MILAPRSQERGGGEAASVSIGTRGLDEREEAWGLPIIFPAPAETPMFFIGLGFRHVRDKTLVIGYSGVGAFAGSSLVVVLSRLILFRVHMAV